MNRRQLLRMSGMVATAGLVSPASLLAQSDRKAHQPICDVKDQGAVGDGLTLDTASLNQAIDRCHAGGGGVVYLSPGTYLSGTVILKSNVTLYLEAGATLLGSKRLGDYGQHSGPPEKADANQRHLIFARDAENIGVAGPGRIDGQGASFWVPSGRGVPPPEESWRDVATYDWKPLQRPSPMLEFYNCQNLCIEDVRIENAAGWTLRPIQCRSVFIRGVTIKNPVIGPNTDGLDLTCSRDVFISDCSIDTGDDAICIKSENPYGGEMAPVKNITITNCILTCCCNGLKIGTSTKGSFESIVFSNSVIFNEDVDPRARVIAGIALEMVDGGSLEGVMISNIRMQRTRTPIFVRLGARHGKPGSLRGVMIDNVHATGALLTSSITGLPGFEVEDVTLSNVRIQSDESGLEEWANVNVPEKSGAYPEARMFGRLPAYGLFCRHVRGLRLNQMEVTGTSNEKRPALHCDEVQDLEVNGLRSSSIGGKQPVVKLVNTREALVRGCSAPAGTKAYLELQGKQSRGNVLMNNEFTRAEKAAQVGAEVPAKALAVYGNAGGADILPTHQG